MTPAPAHPGVDAVRASLPAASAGAAAAAIAARQEGQTATATAGAATLLAAFVAFLAALRALHRAWLVKQLAGKGPEEDVTNVVAGEMACEHAFAQASAERLARAMPAALAIDDPVQRDAKVHSLLEAERRYAQQRADAMAERAYQALDQLRVRRVSPTGAYWKLGVASKHTEGCLQMGEKPWPWEVLDRVHPPRHPGCVSRLLPVDDAIAGGLMRPGEMPDLRTALARSAGVMMEAEVLEVMEIIDGAGA